MHRIEIDPTSDEGARYLLTAPELESRRITIPWETLQQLVAEHLVATEGVEPAALDGALFVLDCSGEGPGVTIVKAVGERA